MSKILTPKQIYQKECYGNRLLPRGRVNRKEYLGSLFLYIALGGIFGLLGLGFLNRIIGHNIVGYTVFGIFSFFALWQVLKIVMTIIKRLHDLNKTGLFFVLPVLGIAIGLTIKLPVLIIHFINIGLYIFWGFMNFTRGTIGENKYGKDPLDTIDE